MTATSVHRAIHQSSWMRSRKNAAEGARQLVALPSRCLARDAHHPWLEVQFYSTTGQHMHGWKQIRSVCERYFSYSFYPGRWNHLPRGRGASRFFVDFPAARECSHPSVLLAGDATVDRAGADRFSLHHAPTNPPGIYKCDVGLKKEQGCYTGNADHAPPARSTRALYTRRPYPPLT